MRLSSIQSRLFLLISVFGVLVTLLNLYFLWGLTKWVEDFIFENLIQMHHAQMVREAHTSREGVSEPDRVFWTGDKLGDFPDAWRPWLAGLEPGVHEEEDALSLMAVVAAQGAAGPRYVVMDTTQLEYIESNTHTVLFYVLLVFAITLMAATLASLFFARQLIRPLQRLTHQVDAFEFSGQAPRFETHGGAAEIRRLSTAFHTLQQRLEAFVKRERRFTQDVSHEMRTPLAVASNALELLGSSGLSEPQEHLLERIQRSNRRMQSLIETFLALGREEGVPRERVDLPVIERMIQETLDYHRFAYPRYQPRLTRELPAETSLDASPGLLGILLRNLLVNAILHSPDQHLLIQGGPGWFRISNQCHGGSRSKDGNGIGLSIASRLAEKSGLNLTHEERDGRFVVTVSSGR
jgi:signal transduction histidine kinase